MAKKVVGILRPFDLAQSFYVYEDGNKIDAAYPTIDEINNTLFQFIEKYDISQIDLTGPKQYARGISNKFQEAELMKYNQHKITINLI